MRPAKVIALGAAVFLFLIGFALLVSGGVLLWAYGAERDSSGFYTTSTQDVSTETYALTTPDANVHLGSTVGNWVPADVRIRAESKGTAPLFIGIGPTDRVSRYLANVAHDEITDFGPFSGGIEYRRVPGVARPTAPGRQDFWVARQEGSGLQTLEWPARSGNWTAVIMNGDAAAGVAAGLDVGARFPILLPIAIVLVAVGLVFLALAVVLVILGLRRPRQAVPPPPPTSAQPPPPPTSAPPPVIGE